MRDWANCLAEQIEVYERVVLEPKIKERNDLKQKIELAIWGRKMKFHVCLFVFCFVLALITSAISFRGPFLCVLLWLSVVIIYNSK